MDELNREVPPLGANDRELQCPLKIVTELELRLLGTVVATPSSDAGLNQLLPPLNPR